MRYRAKAILTFLVLTGLCAAAHAADSVTVRLKWFNQAQFAGFYVAQEKGFYKSAGLDVNIQPGGPDFPAVQMVAGGNEQFGVTGADQILIARSKGVPIVALAVIYRRNPFVMFSLQKSGIKTPADWVGKKVGVKIGGNEELIYRAVLAKAKIDKSQLTEIPVKFDIAPLLDRRYRRVAGLSHQRSSGGGGKRLHGQHRLSVRVRHRFLRRYAVHHRSHAQVEARRGARTSSPLRLRDGTRPSRRPRKRRRSP